MSQEVFDFIKAIVWAPLVAAIGYFYVRNQKEHDMLWKAHNKRIDEIQAVRKDAGDSHSVLMDRVVTHVDDTVSKAVEALHAADVHTEKEVAAVKEHVEKLFENAEKDRALFRDMLMSHVQRSEDRHVELLRGQQDIINFMHTGLAQKADK